MSGGAPREIARTPRGRWVWSPLLDVIDWIPKGRRAPTVTLPVRRQAFDEPGVAEPLRVAARVMARHAEDYS